MRRLAISRKKRLPLLAEVAIAEIAEVLERRQKDQLPVLRNIPRKKLLDETAKVDKVLRKFKAQHYKDKGIILCKSCCCYK